MKKKLFSLLLVLCLFAQLFTAALAAPSTAAGNSIADTNVETPSATIDGTVYEGTIAINSTLQGEYSGADYSATYFAYIPKTADYGERATSAPMLLVYGDAAYTADSAKKTAIDSGLAAIADIEKCPVIFINPSNGTSWQEIDAASLVAANLMFSDSTNYREFTEGKGETNQYPANSARNIVFAEGKGADFAYKYLTNGAAAKGKYFAVATWKPVSLFLMNPTVTNEEALTAGLEVPVYIVNGDANIAAAYKKLNSTADMVITATSTVKSGFEKTALLKAYDEQLEHWYTRHMGPDITLLRITDTSDKLEKTRTDYSFSDGSKVVYYAYAPNAAASKANGTVPLIVSFHGNGNSAEFQVWGSGLDKLAADNGLYILSMDDYNTFSNAKLMEAIKDYVARNPKIDTTRIYISGFSMGSMKTANLGSEYASYFAGSFMMGGFAAPSENAANLIMPVFAYGGSHTHIQAFEFPTLGSHIPAAYLYRVNGVTDSLIYDTNYKWGLKPTSTTVVTASDITTPALTLTIDKFASADGNTYTAFSTAAISGHEPIYVATTEAWKFLSQFSRNADGSIAINGSGKNTTATASGTNVNSLNNFSTGTAYNGFSDVDESKWYGTAQYATVEKAVKLGIMAGDANSNRFRPTSNITIAEALKMAAVVHNTYYGGDADFNIDQGDKWYDSFVGYCVSYGIISAADFEDYGAKATRAEVAYIFANCLPASALADKNTVTYIPDCSATDAYYAEILKLYKAGIVVGDSGTNNFRAGSNITRAEAAAIIARICIASERMEVTLTK